MPSRVSIADLLRLRLAAQHISGAGLSSPAETVRALLAMQAQDFPAACWAIGARTAGARLTDIRSALDSAWIVRSWPLRGTLHFVASEDLSWMLSVTAARTLASARTSERQLGLDEHVVAAAAEATVTALSGGKALSRNELLTVFENADIDTTGQRGYRIIWHLAQTGLVCWGPTHGTQQAVVLLDEWVPRPRRLDHDEALRELAVRYVRGHGPATVRDFAWWAKITLAEARTGLALAADDLERLEIDGAVHWLHPAAASLLTAGPPARREREGVYALGGFDEYVLGYRDRSPIVTDEEHLAAIVPGKNGIFLPTIVAGGRVVGTWRRTQRSASVTVDPLYFGDAPAWQRRGFQRAAAAYGRFLGADAVTLESCG